MKMVKMILVLIVVSTMVAGCQFDTQVSTSSKWLRKGENGNNEYKSRSSGMSGGNSYASDGGSFLLWGNNREGIKER